MSASMIRVALLASIASGWSGLAFARGGGHSYPSGVSVPVSLCDLRRSAIIGVGTVESLGEKPVMLASQGHSVEATEIKLLFRRTSDGRTNVSVTAYVLGEIEASGESRVGKLRAGPEEMYFFLHQAGDYLILNPPGLFRKLLDGQFRNLNAYSRTGVPASLLESVLSSKSASCARAELLE